MMRTLSCWTMVSILLCGTATAQAAECTLEKAVYRTADPQSDYELTFAAGELGGGSQMEVALNSKSLGFHLDGTVEWTNGFAKPIIILYLPNTEESRYSDEIVALAIDARKRIAKVEFPTTADAAPKAILLPGISGNLFNYFRDEGFYPGKTPLPDDMFWLSRCDK